MEALCGSWKRSQNLSRNEFVRIHTLSFSACILLVITSAFSCGTPSREESRQIRLDAFRNALPADVLVSFDSISTESDCIETGLLLDSAMSSDPSLAAVIDSIKHDELIDAFSNRDLVYYFWYYFAHALQTGTVEGP